MNVAVYEPRKIAVIAARDIFEKTKHQNEETGKWTRLSEDIHCDYNISECHLC